MNDKLTLAGALARAAGEFERIEPPPALRERVLDAVAPGRQAARASPWAWGGGATFAAVLVGSAVLMLRQSAVEAPAGEAGAGAFVPLVPAERWPPASSQAWLVSTEMPRERLAAFGLPFDPARAGDSVRAELLVRASGEVLAVRFVR
jgi:hypothetical protein